MWYSKFGNKNYKGEIIYMIPQIKYYRQRFIKYAIKNGVTKALIRYKISRKTIYKWLKRYDGTLESLEDLSRRPKIVLKNIEKKALNF